MQIKRMSKEAYSKLIDYVFQTCEIIGLKKYTSGHTHSNLRVINVILNNLPKELNISYTMECLDFLCKKFINNPIIFNKGYQNQYEKNHLGWSEKNFKKMIEYNRKSIIKSSVLYYINDISTNDFLLKNYKSLILIKEDINKGANYDISSYYFKIDKNFKNEMKKKNSIFDWRFPLTLEDICFFNKNGLCWLWSTSHEEICEICFQEGEEKEYEYLKSIGIEFVEKEFTPTPKEYLFYLEDDLKD